MTDKITEKKTEEIKIGIEKGIGIVSEIEIEVKEKEDTDHEVRNAENVPGPEVEKEETAKEVLLQKKVVAQGEENLPFIGMFRPQGLSTLPLYR